MGHDHCHRHGCMCYGGCPDCNPNSQEGKAIDMPPMQEPITVSFEYLNHRGERAMRTVDLDAIEFMPMATYGYQPGWFISGRCHTKNMRRSFALSRIIFADMGIMRDPFSLRLRK